MATCGNSDCTKGVSFNYENDNTNYVNSRTCEFEGCGKRPTYGNIGEKAKRCVKHKSAGMVDVIHKLCESEGCGKRPNYNFRNEIGGRFCSKHKQPNMVDVTRPMCESEECDKRPSYGIKGEKAKRCAKHKTEGMIDVVSKRCGADGCDKIASCNVKGKTGRRFCSKHKSDNMVSVNGDMCQANECGKRATFNYEGEIKRLYCAKHKLDQMVDVSHKLCESLGCTKRANHNLPDKSNGRFCAKHKDIGMINVVDSQCEIEGCTVRPGFGYEGCQAKRCKRHRDHDMVDVKNKVKCETCGKQAGYNYEGELRARFCVKHKDDGMIDVKHQTCKIPNCGVRAIYGHPHQCPIRCAQHKEPNMVFNPRKRCNFKNIATNERCMEWAVYGYKSHTTCEAHKAHNMINFLEYECSHCHMPNILSETTTRCSSCDTFLENKVRKFKEMDVKYFLDTHQFVYLSHDRKIKGSVLLLRPDFVFVGKNNKYYVVLEVDEFQHSLNREECECVRMVNISHELGKPTIFIRFNPDGFIVEGIEGGCNPSQGVRKEVLHQWLTKLLNMDIEEVEQYGYLSFVKLFYDGYRENQVEIINVLEQKNSSII